MPPAELLRWLDGRKLDAVIHMGAISDTTATDGDLVMENNFRLSLRLLDWCTATRTPFIYASSAATYGDGAAGLRRRLVARGAAAAQADEPLRLEQASVRSGGGRARRAARTKLPPQWAGLKFFNVFGPNEYHKGEMMSLVAKRFDEAKAGKPVRLFKSHRAGIADGEQRRDFIYVDDAVAVVRWLLETPSVSGIFNVGTGKARSFRDLITAHVRGARPRAEHRICRHAGRRSATSYQYFTQAEVENLRRAGYNAGFTPLEDGGAALRDAVLSTAPTAIAERTGTAACSISKKRCQSSCRADRALRRRPDARRFRLWRGVAHFAGGAGAGDRGQAQRDR